MSAAVSSQHRITTEQEAENLITRIGDLMVALVKVFREETQLVKAGKLRDAAELTPEKTELASRYLREIELFKANGPFVGQAAPGLLDELRRAHTAFRDILAHNLKVVATAQSVAEDIVRGAAEEAASRTAPKGYSADGRIVRTPAARPVMLSRSS